MTAVVVPIHAARSEDLRAQADAAHRAGADLVEVRFDLCLQAGLPLDDAAAATTALPVPIMATLRHADEGGAWTGSESERRAFYEQLTWAGWVDVEAGRFADPAWRGFRPAGRLVLSLHDFTGMGAALPTRVAGMYAAGAEIAKVAVTAGDAHDLAVIERLLRSERRPLISVAMGEHGLPSRLLAGVWGAAMTFAKLPGGGTAPGQPTVQEVLGTYRLRAQRPHTRVFGVIGSPISHSLSPLIHNAALEHLGLDAVYVPFRVEDPARFWKDCGGWLSGLSVTIPHKESLQASMDGLEDLAAGIGAMNTVYRDGEGRLIGANTDAVAIAACLEAQLGTLHGRTVLVLGAGGVARAAVHACRDRGAEVRIANRTATRAKELAAETGCVAIDWNDAPAIPYDVLINGTAVGMRKEGRDLDESPWPAEAHRPGSVVFDTVYIPLETKLLRDAQLAGCRTICGLDMFISQAEGQFSRWFHRQAPGPLMRRVALERLTPAASQPASR